MMEGFFKNIAVAVFDLCSPASSPLLLSFYTVIHTFPAAPCPPIFSTPHFFCHSITLMPTNVSDPSVIAKGTLGIREFPSSPACVKLFGSVHVVNRYSPDGLVSGVLSVCLANEIQPITLQALLAANQMEIGKLRDDDGAWSIALILHFVNVKESLCMNIYFHIQELILHSLSPSLQFASFFAVQWQCWLYLETESLHMN